MSLLGRTLLGLGFVITVVSVFYLLFGSMEFPRGNTIGDLEYHSRTFHPYFLLFACLIVSGVMSLALWLGSRR